jgi:hypothetical protein
LQSKTISVPTVNNNTITVRGIDGLTGSGSFSVNQSFDETVTIVHANTSSQADVNNSGVNFIQDIYLDTYGHVTSIGSASIASAIAGVAAGSVGSYAFLYTGSTSARAAGSTLAGSSLKYSGVGGYQTNIDTADVYISSSGTPSGTWRLMGATTQSNGLEHSSLFLRIA